MIYSLMEDDNNLYISIHVEVVFAEFILRLENVNKDNQQTTNENYEFFPKFGFFKDGLEADTFADIVDSIIIFSYGKKNVIFDFKRINEFSSFQKKNENQASINRLYFDMIEKKYDLIFVNTPINIFRNFAALFKMIPNTIKSRVIHFSPIPNYLDSDPEKINNFIFTLKRLPKFDSIAFLFLGFELPRIKIRLLNNKIRYFIKEACYPQNIEGKSSSRIIKLSHYIDIKQIIENKFVFYHFVYLLSELLYDELFKNKSIDEIYNKKENSPLLFIQSINGSIIASTISKLLRLDLYFIDHLGPIYMLANSSISNISFERKNIIIVCDVICTASEIDRAENLIQYKSGNVIGYLTFVNIGFFEKENEFLLFLYNVLDDGNRLDYQIEINKPQKLGGRYEY